jgi:3-hydroxybutyryl-CoA dehydrogenase
MAIASEIAAVGVIGAGQMGSGIAQLAAAAGCAVLLLDADPAALSRAVASISASLRRLAAKGQLSQVRALTSQSTLPDLVPGCSRGKKDAAFSSLLDKFWGLLGLQAACEDSIKRIRCVSTVQDLRDADLVVEAIVENEDVKKKLFVELDKITKSSAILASNTSSISITRLASATKRPSQVMSDLWRLSIQGKAFEFTLQDSEVSFMLQVIGMHFFNPPPIMKLIEIIRGADTSDEVFAAIKSFSER